MECDGKWLSILDYSKYRKMSISTVRRHIKAGRVSSKLEEGKYYIFVSSEKLKKSPIDNDVENLSDLHDKISQLKHELRILREENLELKMLVDIYEKKESSLYKSLGHELDDLPAIPLS